MALEAVMELVLVDQDGLEFTEIHLLLRCATVRLVMSVTWLTLHSETPCQNEIEHYSYCHTLA